MLKIGFRILGLALLLVTGPKQAAFTKDLALKLPLGANCPTGKNCMFSGRQGSNKDTMFNCDPGSVIRVDSATFSASGMTQVCTSVIASACNAKASCAMNYGQKTCGGNLPQNSQKTTSTVVACLQTLSFGTECSSALGCQFTGAAEWGPPVSMSCKPGTKIRVTQSSYGTGDKTRTCTPYVKSLCEGKIKCDLSFTNGNCGGDPAYGSPKEGSAMIQCL
jgi:hypothetical protein